MWLIGIWLTWTRVAIAPSARRHRSPIVTPRAHGADVRKPPQASRRQSASQGSRRRETPHRLHPSRRPTQRRAPLNPLPGLCVDPGHFVTVTNCLRRSDRRPSTNHVLAHFVSKTSRRLAIGRSAGLKESGRHMVRLRLATSRHACHPPLSKPSGPSNPSCRSRTTYTPPPSIRHSDVILWGAGTFGRRRLRYSHDGRRSFRIAQLPRHRPLSSGDTVFDSKSVFARPLTRIHAPQFWPRPTSAPPPTSPWS
ncbi:hypothetical protein HNP02_001209 [Mycobacterium sp. AZCC_0083]|nr:hypothetical protein [Mycobacterium sp. AZCC_0083]